MDELIFHNIRSISYDKYNKDGYRTFNFTVGQYLASIKAEIVDIRFDEIHFINTKVPRYVIMINRGDGTEMWKAIPAYKASVEEDLSC